MARHRPNIDSVRIRDQLPPLDLTAEGREIGDFLIFNGVAFLVLALLVCVPRVLARSISPIHRSTALVGIFFGTLVCIHDVMAGSEIRNGNDFLLSNLILPAHKMFPTQPNILVWILLIISLLLVTVGTAWVVVQQTRRTSRRSQARSRRELFDFPDMNP